MDTEGLKEENKLKPAITAELEGTSDVLSAEEATKALFKGLQKGEFAITSEFNGYMLRVIGNGTRRTRRKKKNIQEYKRSKK